MGPTVWYCIEVDAMRYEIDSESRPLEAGGDLGVAIGVAAGVADHTNIGNVYHGYWWWDLCWRMSAYHGYRNCVSRILEMCSTPIGR